MKPPILIRSLAKITRVTDVKGKGTITKILKNYVQNKGYSEIINFDMGEHILINLDDWILGQIYFDGVYEIEKVHANFFKKLVGKDTVFFDVGANVGYYTLQAAVRGSKVYSFEPATTTLKHLNKNIEINNFFNVDTYQYIISDYIGTSTIYIADNVNTGKSRCTKAFNSTSEYEEIEMITLDCFVESNNVNKIDLVKIDVEGFEMNVLRGMTSILKTLKPNILIEINSNNLAEQNISPIFLFQYLYDMGYISYYIEKEGLKETDSYIKDDNLVLFKPKS